jgi:glutamate N-acetyltransferase/amino-acid N-acetyltransferase
MCALVAEGIGCQPEEVLVCSTGLIGIPLQIDAVESGIPKLLAAREPEGFADAARAMMTTDLGPKDVIRSGDGFVVRGIAKGAAMLAPHMATMLAVLATDAAAGPDELHAALVAAVAGSFNALSIDGATSTNDTVIALAGGVAGLRDGTAGVMADVCAELATLMADGAEGATKRAHVRVTGAATTEEAARAARKVAESQLVQCSLYGGDPYWGRIVSELGSAGVAFDIDRVAVAYNGVEVCRAGVGVPGATVSLAGPVVDVACDLGLGDGTAAITTTDLSPEYIAENMRTS